jgi:ethanolamine ammonia-lyase small subunit
MTLARIGLGRTGVSQPTRATLAFALDHARARDAVRAPLDVEALARRIGPCVTLASAAPDRAAYLARPDLGARLREPLEPLPPAAPDLVIVLADGLSSRALTHAPDLLAHLLPGLDGLRLAPLIIATQARVALADEIGQSLGAAMSLVLIGERPGLTAPDSLGAYLTWAPRVGRTNAERNCVSNIRPAGLAPPDAAHTLAWLIHEGRRLRLTGIRLKDESRLRRVSTREDRGRMIEEGLSSLAAPFLSDEDFFV